MNKILFSLLFAGVSFVEIQGASAGKIVKEDNTDTVKTKTIKTKTKTNSNISFKVQSKTSLLRLRLGEETKTIYTLGVFGWKQSTGASQENNDLSGQMRNLKITD